MNMKTLTLTAALIGALNLFATSTPAGFTDDLEAALNSAKEKGKLVYVCFSGSDWCHWCVKLESEVFSDETFAASLTNDYELVFIDSPSDKSRLSETAKVKNPELTKKYNIRGFPSMIILDGADGSVIVQTGAYRAGGAKNYIDMLMEIRKDPSKLKREKALHDEWIKPLKDEYVKLMRKRAAMTEFKALKDKAEAKAKEAPEEIREAVNGFAAQLGAWIEKVEAAK